MVRDLYLGDTNNDGSTTMLRKRPSPIIVLATSAIATSAFIALMLLLPRYDDARERYYLFIYNAPIAFVFVAYLFDRAERGRAIRLRQGLIEPCVIGLAMTRALVPVPLISGHALFLTYTILTTPRRLAWWLAVLVLIEVSYIKIVLLHDATLIGGALIGIVAALFVTGKPRAVNHPVNR